MTTLLRMPRRPALRPGLPVARRDDGHLQVGVDPPLRAVLPATPEVRRLLAALRGGRMPDLAHESAATALLRLLDLDLVVEADGHESDRAHFGTGATARLQRRTAGSVGLRGGSGPLLRRARTLLAEAGLRPADRRGPPPTAWLVLSEGEPSRAAVDDLVREGAPHLLVVSRLARVEVGPLVEPGGTACLRCVDAHRAELDPRRHLVVDQAARSVAEGSPQPHDPVLWALGLAWAVRDLARYLEGDRPATWSATVEVGPLEAPASRSWHRHPHCGCAWDGALL